MLLIANPAAAAGRAGTRWKELLRTLRARGVPTEQVTTERPGHAWELARQAAGEYEVLVAAGGDGTVNEVANGILTSGARDTKLAVAPLGTGNDVAQLLGVPTVADTVETLIHGQPRPMDVIEIAAGEGAASRTHFALLFAAVGFATEILHKTTPAVKRFFGPRYCYSVGFFQALFSYRAPLVRARGEGGEFTGRMLLACAGNSPFAGGGVMHFSPGARLDDGLLNISLIDAVGRLATLRQFFRLLKGTHVHHPKVRYFTGTSLAVETDPSVPIQIDGDHFCQTPATFRVRPGGVPVLVNPSAAARLEWFSPPGWPQIRLAG
jgi:YegS/Rv2252/BmrU family lipid kinase